MQHLVKAISSHFITSFATCATCYFGCFPASSAFKSAFCPETLIFMIDEGH